MNTLKSGYRWLGILVLGFLSSTALIALPTVVNYMPNCDTVAPKTLMLQVSNYSYRFTDTATKAAIKKDSSMIYSMEFGFKKAEVGVDFIGTRSFVDTRSALYAGPVAFNLKYRLLTQGQKKDTFSLAVGTYNLGVKKYAADYYVPAPYVIATKAFKDLRLHLGYQFNILGFKRLDTDRKRNDGILFGFDTVVIKDAKKPVTLLADYFGGPAATVALGVTQNFTPKLNWCVCYYIPTKSKLPVSKSQLPKQLWVALSYYLPL